MFYHSCSDLNTVEFKDFLKYAFNVLEYRYQECVQWIKINLTMLFSFGKIKLIYNGSQILCLETLLY